MREAWEKKQEELSKKGEEDTNDVRKYGEIKTVNENYDQVLAMLNAANGNAKTTAAMNQLIPYVYEKFGKNAGSNTNRKVKTVITQLKAWELQRQQNEHKKEEWEAKLNEKKQALEAKKKKATEVMKK